MPISPKSRFPAAKAKAGGKRSKRSEEELESDRNALRVEREFSKMGNKFYKDPDLENLQEDHTPTDISDREPEHVAETVDSDDMSEIARSNVASSSRKLVAGGKSRSDATSSTRKPAPDDNPLSEIFEAQTKITLMIVKNDVAEFLKAILNDPYMFHMKQGSALPAGKSLVFYADDPGHMLELSRYVDVALRGIIRPMTLSPDGEPKDPIPVQREHQAVEQVAPQGEQSVVVAKDSPLKTTSADAVIENSLVRKASARTFADIVVITVLACASGTLAAWIIMEYEINGTAAAANFALRAIDGLAGARTALFRRVCLIIYDILGVVVSTLMNLHGTFAEFAGRR